MTMDDMTPTTPTPEMEVDYDFNKDLTDMANALERELPKLAAHIPEDMLEYRQLTEDTRHEKNT